jgi:toxin ParE1/3/4
MESIVDYLAKCDPAAAMRFCDAIDLEFACLSRNPGMGAARSYRHPLLEGLRMWPMRDSRRYLIFYRSAKDGIEIVRIIHASRDIAALFEESKDS